MCDVIEENWYYVGKYIGDFQDFTQSGVCINNIFLSKETRGPFNPLKPIFGFSSPSLAAVSNKNIIQATYVILNLLVVSFKKLKEADEINFNNVFYLT